MNLEFEFVNHANEVACNMSEAVGAAISELPALDPNQLSSFEDYDNNKIHCSVYFADFGFPGKYWMYSVDWYNKEGRLVKGNVGSASTREEANKKALEVAKQIHEQGYSHEPKQVAWNKETSKYAEGTVRQY